MQGRLRAVQDPWGKGHSALFASRGAVFGVAACCARGVGVEGPACVDAAFAQGQGRARGRREGWDVAMGAEVCGAAVAFASHACAV